MTADRNALWSAAVTAASQVLGAHPDLISLSAVDRQQLALAIGQATIEQFEPIAQPAPALTRSDREALDHALHCLTIHCRSWDPGHNAAKVVLHRLTKSAAPASRSQLDAVVAAFRASGQESISLIDMPSVPNGPLVHVMITAGSRSETEEFVRGIRATEPEQVWRDGKTWLVSELREPGLTVLIRSDDLTAAEQTAA